MSVPAGERKENQFALHMSAVGLAGHTLRITANPKVFKPHINPAIIQRICELSVGIAENIEKANRVQLNAGKTNFNNNQARILPPPKSGKELRSPCIFLAFVV